RRRRTTRLPRRVHGSRGGLQRDSRLCRNGRPAEGGQAQSEGRTGAFLAPHGHLAGVRGGHMLDDGQAQAGAAGRARTGRVDPEETLEDPLQRLLRYADALIADADLDALPRGAGADHHAGVLRAVDDRVVDEVAQRGHQQLLVTPDAQPLRAPGDERDVLGVGAGVAVVDGDADGLVDGDLLGGGNRLRPLYTAQRDDVLDQVVEPGRLVLHAGREPGDGLRV